MGGKDDASERYIFTKLNNITRQIFPEVDDNILTYLEDDGDSVEPIYYMPIIPMILVNGSKGIGTGFSTDIMCHNPLQIISYIEGILNKNSEVEQKSIKIEPYYKNFKGTIEVIDDKKFIIKGKYEFIDKDKIKITELPVGTWTQDYKEFLESLLDNKSNKESKSKVESYIKDFNDMSTDNDVEFDIQFYPGILIKLINEKHDYNLNGIQKYLKLYTTQSTTNMHLFNEKEQLRKYENVYNIIDDYYKIRLEFYKKRKDYLINKLNKEIVLLSNKAKFIQYNLDDKIDLRKKSNTEIIKIMENLNFDKHVNDNNYNYLTKLPMDSVSKENVEKIMREYQDKTKELEIIKIISIEKMWLNDLNNLKIAYNEFIELDNINQSKSIVKKCKK
jgi:DNA topoisomerase-2